VALPTGFLPAGVSDIKVPRRAGRSDTLSGDFAHSRANAGTSRQTSSDKRTEGDHDSPIRTAKQFE
jgi:hypothetical protein